MNIDLPIQMYDPSRDYNIHKVEIDNAIQTVINEGKFINGPQVKTFAKNLEKFSDLIREISTLCFEYDEV